jgi:hypothetical protein
MKKLLMFFIIPAIVFPVFTAAQFMKDYRPTGSPLVSSTVNLISVVEATATAAGSSRAINTIQESAAVVTNDVWVHAVNAAGNVTFSRRYGIAGTEETAAALIRCPNGDFIYAATTNTAGIQSSWLFRVGIINWSFRYFAAGNRVKSYCIKKTNEAVENYIIAASINSDRRLLVFKINAAGGLVWNRQYVDPAPPVGLTDIPKSMLINRDTIVIAGNRTSLSTAGATLRDLFVIGINQATGAISHPYRVIDNPGHDDKDPFINFGLSAEYVLTYQCTANIAGVNTGRIAFTRLNTFLALVTGTTSLLWETNAINSFGHSIYISTTAGTAYDIGGGALIGNLNNPLFTGITNTGLPVAGTYRRLWTTFDFNSTFMLQDAFTAANRYEHHNFKRAAAQNSMSLLRDNSLAPPCNVNLVLNQQFIDVIAPQRQYNPTPIIVQAVYNIPNVDVHGTIITCNSALIGIFKGEQPESFGETDIAQGLFRAYPTLLQSGEILSIELKSAVAASVTVRVYNMQSQIVYNRKETAIQGQNRFTVMTTGWMPGTYITEVKQGSETYRSKIVVD